MSGPSALELLAKVDAALVETHEARRAWPVFPTVYASPQDMVLGAFEALLAIVEDRARHCREVLEHSTGCVQDTPNGPSYTFPRLAPAEAEVRAMAERLGIK